MTSFFNFQNTGRWIACAIFCSYPITFISAQSGGGLAETMYQWHGAAANDYFGASVATAGDLDGDGIPDLAVGANGADPGGVNVGGSVYFYSGATGRLIFRLDGSVEYASFGSAMSGGGDINGDGVPDLIMGNPWADSGSINAAGSARVHSGVDGSVLYEWFGMNSGEHMGRSISHAGDVNSDGFGDIIVGAQGAISGGSSIVGSAFVFSGMDGSVLYRWNGAAAYDAFGLSVAGVGDISGDGIPDLLVGAPYTDPAGFDLGGSAYVYSGADGTLLYQWDGRAEDDLFGRAVAAAGDINADGIEDLAVADMFAHSSTTTAAGSVNIYSGADGTLLYQWKGTEDSQFLGASIAAAGDFNGDGFADMIASSEAKDNGWAWGHGAAYVFSGADGEILQYWEGPTRQAQFGRAVAGVGDLDGDGRDEVLVGTPRFDARGRDASGVAHVFSFNPFMASSGTSISASTGQSIDFQLDFPRAAAIYSYKILMSVSGPGQMFFGVEIPLAEDFMVYNTFRGTYPFATYSNLHGTLNADGDASANVDIAVGEIPLSLIGRTLHIAAVASSDSLMPAEYSSVAIPIEILP